MGKYLITGSYTAEGVKGLLADGGTKRKESIAALLESVGGSLESIYYMFGTADVVITCDAPDDESIASIALTVSASGLASVVTTVLLTTEQIDAAAKMSPAYRPPGG